MTVYINLCACVNNLVQTWLIVMHHLPQGTPKGSATYTQAALVITENYQYLLFATAVVLCHHYLRKIPKYI